MQCSKRYKTRAFSLIEFLIVIGIFGILAGIGILTFRTYQPTLQLSGVVRDLVSDIRYTQQLAVGEQVDHGIRFASTTREYQIIRYVVPEEVLQEKQLPVEVNFSEITGFEQEEVIFNSFGAVGQAGTVTLVNTQNATTTIDIRPSGFVRIIK